MRPARDQYDLRAWEEPSSKTTHRAGRAALIATAALLYAAPVLSAEPNLRPLLDAIREVESGGDPSVVGDGGRSIGPYQIQRPYWRDAGIPGKYELVKTRWYSEKVMIAYWRRHCPEALAHGNFQVLARVHNGGPEGWKNPQTRYYWQKVVQAMRR